MKIKIIFVTAVSIMMFAVLTNAQTHVRVFDGSSYADLIPASPSTTSAELPLLTLVAGKPIRVRIAAEKDKDELIVAGVPGANGHVKTTAIPCEKRAVNCSAKKRRR